MFNHVKTTRTEMVQSALNPVAATALPQASVSAAMMRVNSSRLVSAGTLDGATTPNHEENSRFIEPCSLMVGTSANATRQETEMLQGLNPGAIHYQRCEVN